MEQLESLIIEWLGAAWEAVKGVIYTYTYSGRIRLLRVDVKKDIIG